MCVTLIGAGVGLAGTAVSAAMSFKQASTEKKIAARNAELERQQGEYEAKQIDRKRRYVQGVNNVAAGKSGIGFDGSFLDVIADNEVQAEVDKENAIRLANNKANITKASGKARANRTKFGAVSTIIGGAGTFLKAVA